MKTQYKTSEYFSQRDVRALQKALHVEHEHGEGQNECLICDEPLLRAACREIAKLRKERKIALEAAHTLRLACRKALDWATGEGDFNCERDTIKALAEEVSPALEAALMDSRLTEGVS